MQLAALEALCGWIEWLDLHPECSREESTLEMTRLRARYRVSEQVFAAVMLEYYDSLKGRYDRALEKSLQGVLSRVADKILPVGYKPQALQSGPHPRPVGCNRPCQGYILAVPKKPPKSEREFRVGDKVVVSIHGGRIADAIVKAVTTDDQGH